MNKKILLLDMDGPIADFDQHFWDECKRHGVTLNIDSLDHQDRKRFMTENIPDPNECAYMRYAVDQTRWFMNLPVTPGATEGVEVLMEEFDVWVCTKPLDANKYCLSDKREWLEKYFPALSTKLITAPEKSMVFGHVLLDDAPHLGCISKAFWNPVVFRSGFNETPGNPWDMLHSWSWGDSTDILHSQVSGW